MFGTIALGFFSDSSDSEDISSDSPTNSPSKSPIHRHSKFPIHRTSKQSFYQKYKKTKRFLEPDNGRLRRRFLRDSTNILELPEEHFIQNFRVSKLIFTKILEEISPKLPITFKITHVPIPIKLARFLAFVALDITGANKAYSAILSKSQVSRTINEILDVFEEHLAEKWLILNRSEEDEMLIKNYFHKSCGLPGIVGGVGNTHVRIKTPDKYVKNIYNSGPGISSINVLMVYDQDKVIRYVDAKPGSYSDAQIWKQSDADTYFRENYINGKNNTWLVGDSNYNLLPYLMVPYKNPQKEHEKVFNEKLSIANETTALCINELKNHFKCLKSSKGLYYTPEKAKKTIISCCILHNMCIKYNNTWRPTNRTFDYDENTLNTYKCRENSEECEEGRSIRDELALQSCISYTQPAVPEENKEEENKDNSGFRLRDATALLDYPDVKFLRTFGVNKKVFSALLEEIKPYLKITYRVTHTPAPIKLATFLEFLATGRLLKELGNEYTSQISKCHVSKIITEMLDIFEEHLYRKWIQLEQTQEEENTVKLHFYNATGLAGVVGCVDNMHIQIRTPAKELKPLYINRKELYSLNVLMICDHNMVIKYVDANQPGSYQDSQVWEQSSANNYFHNNFLNGKTSTWLLGDRSYNLQPYLMVPYKDANATHEYEFNYKHFEARKIIKNCFDILKNRFKCLTTEAGIQYTPDKASKIITACCVLHNFCINHKNYWQPCNFSLESLDDEDCENIIETPPSESLKLIRDKIAQNLDIFM